jgi:hypothetical protein
MLLTEKEKEHTAFGNEMERRESVIGGRIRTVITLEALEDFYDIYAPEKVGSAAELLGRYAHGELVLLLKGKYGDSPAVWEVPELEKEVWEEHLRDHVEYEHDDWDEIGGSTAEQLEGGVIELQLEALRKFYTIHAPEKVADAAIILENIRGRELVLIEALRNTYGAAPEYTQAHVIAAPAVHLVVTLDSLQDFYSRHAPEKVRDAAAILHSVHGHEAEMIEALQAKYGDAPAASLAKVPSKLHVVVTVESLQQFYSIYNPAKVDTAAQILYDLSSQEAEMVEALLEKYGDAPEHTMVMAEENEGGREFRSKSTAADPLATLGAPPALSAGGEDEDLDVVPRPLSLSMSHAQLDRPLIPSGNRGMSKKKPQIAQGKHRGMGLAGRSSQRGRAGRSSQGRRQSVVLKPKPEGKQFEAENLLFRQMAVVNGSVLQDEGEWSNAYFAVDQGQLLKFGVSSSSPSRIWSLFDKRLEVDFAGSTAVGGGGATQEGSEGGEGRQGRQGEEGEEEAQGSFVYRNPLTNNRKGTHDENFQFEVGDAGLSDLAVRFMATSVEQKWAWVRKIRCGIKFAELQHLSQLYADTALETAIARVHQVEEEADPEQRRKHKSRTTFRGSVTKLIIANRFKTVTKTEAAAIAAEQMQAKFEALDTGASGSAGGIYEASEHNDGEDEETELTDEEERRFEAATLIAACWRGVSTRKKAGFNIKMLRHRLKVSLEMLETERSYNHGLKNVVEVVVTPLKWKAEHSGTPVLSLQDISTVFCNVVQLQELSTMLLKSMQEVIDNAHGSSGRVGCKKQQRAGELKQGGRAQTNVGRLSIVLGATGATAGGEVINTLAKVFLHYGPFFNLYSEYLRNYGAGKSIASDLCIAVIYFVYTGNIVTLTRFSPCCFVGTLIQF